MTQAPAPGFQDNWMSRMSGDKLAFLCDCGEEACFGSKADFSRPHTKDH